MRIFQQLNGPLLPLFLSALLPVYLTGCAGSVETTSIQPQTEPESDLHRALAEPEPSSGADRDRRGQREGWMALATAGAPQGREDHTAIWTGSEMIVWGGEIRSEGVMPLNTGARYNPVSDSWLAMSGVGAPDRRDDHAVVWTGTEMIVWGGNQADENSELLASGGRYDPAADRWTTMAVGPLSPRDDPTAVWTGTEMIVWGGSTLWRRHEGSGARYNPELNRWSAMTGLGAPHAREDHTAVWTGDEMIIWGGWSGRDDARRHFNDGARYNPRLDKWTPISTKGAPAPREDHTAVWTGKEMLVWGGVVHRYNKRAKKRRAKKRKVRRELRPVEDAADEDAADEDAADGEAVPDPPEAEEDEAAATPPSDRPSKRARKRSRKVQLASGALYNPVTDTWRPMTMTGAPEQREDHVAIWMGSELFIWGGRNGGNKLADGALYDPATDSWRAIAISDGELSPRWNHTAVLADNQVLIWGGFADGYDDGGTRYLP